MKKMKKIVALLLAMAMVMGMSLTAFATALTPTEATGEKGSITITGLSKTETTTVKLYQVVKWNESESSWTVVEGVGNNITIPSDASQATFNWEGLRALAPSLNFTGFITDEKTADINGQVVFSGLDEGAYLVVATGDGTEYSAMGAGLYVYNDTTHLMVPGDITISAKATTYTVAKKLVDDTKTFINRGDEIQYTITTVFPSYNDTLEAKDRIFTITDQPTGLTITGISVTVGGATLTSGTDYTLKNGDNAVTLPAQENQAVTVDFTSNYIGTANAHAGETVVVTVTTKATGDPFSLAGGYKNEANTNKAGEPSTVTSTTGSITITKKDEADNDLTGAIFNVKLGEETLMFVPSGTTLGEYMLAQNGEANAAKNVGGKDISTIVLKGLGAGKDYSIVEVQAPDGYSINTNITPAIQAITENDAAQSWIVKDTKLSSLPSTGGIGTTIFTIGGCLIMIVAAGLFFATRKKSAK